MFRDVTSQENPKDCSSDQRPRVHAQVRSWMEKGDGCVCMRTWIDIHACLLTHPRLHTGCRRHIVCVCALSMSGYHDDFIPLSARAFGGPYDRMDDAAAAELGVRAVAALRKHVAHVNVIRPASREKGCAVMEVRPRGDMPFTAASTLELRLGHMVEMTLKSGSPPNIVVSIDMKPYRKSACMSVALWTLWLTGAFIGILAMHSQIA